MGREHFTHNKVLLSFSFEQEFVVCFVTVPVLCFIYLSTIEYIAFSTLETIKANLNGSQKICIIVLQDVYLGLLVHNILFFISLLPIDMVCLKLRLVLHLLS